MPYDKYVQINETWHQIGDDEHTISGVPIPPLTEWVKELPEGAKLAERDVFGDLGRAAQKTEAEIKAIIKSKAKAKK